MGVYGAYDVHDYDTRRFGPVVNILLTFQTLMSNKRLGLSVTIVFDIW